MMQWLIFKIKFIFDSIYLKSVVSRLEISPYKEHIKWAQKIKNILNKFNIIIHLSKICIVSTNISSSCPYSIIMLHVTIM